MNQTASTRTLAWTGVSHFGIFTADLDATIAFYRDILEFDAGPVRDADGVVVRHCFLSPSSGEGKFSIHVLELPGAHTFSSSTPLRALENESAYVAQGGKMDTSMPICYFNMELSDARAGNALRARLLENGVECTRPIDRGPTYQLVFRDNNGMMLGAIWHKESE